MNIRRIEASILNAGQDFDWTMTPYEANLGWMVDLNKASFCGKEALARVHRDKQGRHLVGLRLHNTAVPEEGAQVFSAGDCLGEVTSATLSPTLNTAIVIAVTRGHPPVLGSSLVIETPGGRETAEVVSMPFLDPERRLSKA